MEVYVYKTGNGKYTIAKRDNKTGKRIYYGTYETKQEAEKKRDELIRDGVITPTVRINHNLPKHITYTNIYADGKPRYRITKTIDGKVYYYATFDTVEEAEAKVEELEQNGWKGIEKPKYDRKRRYVYLTRFGTYQIKKRDTCYGTYHRLEDAIAERDYLESIDWDYDNMD